jgi:hypothetical protein
MDGGSKPTETANTTTRVTNKSSQDSRLKPRPLAWHWHLQQQGFKHGYNLNQPDTGTRGTANYVNYHNKKEPTKFAF